MLGITLLFAAAALLAALAINWALRWAQATQ
jgi:hypothetical protein